MNAPENLLLTAEALIFSSPEPLNIKELAAVLTEIKEESVSEEDCLLLTEKLSEKYASEHYPFGIYQIGGGFRFLTKPDFKTALGVLLKQKSSKKLSKAALETLSVIAYEQPVTKSRIEHVRGVNCDYAVRRLLEKELIEICGKTDGPGRPLLYGTSDKFSDRFGLNSLKDLPQLKEFRTEENAVGEEAD